MCRSLLSPWKDEEGKEVYRGRANTGVCSINLPRIALESGGDKELFYGILTERLNLAKEVCLWRYKRLVSLKAKEAPFTYIGGVFGMTLDPEDSVEKVYSGGRGSLSIGYIGCAEVNKIMVGEDIRFGNKAFEFQQELMKFLSEAVDDYTKDTQLSFGLYAMPGESTTERFCNIDRKQFGEVEGVTDKGFYVNSFHVNTATEMTPFEKIDIESEFQKLSKGGHVFFCEVDNIKKNLEAYETIVKYARDKGMMYAACNSSWDTCLSCDWTGELDVNLDIEDCYICPECGESNQDKIVKTIRLCGYLTTLNKRPPVEGRIKEIRSRVKHG